MVSSINSNVAALYAQSNINSASNRASSSISRLSSGNRIVRASDDVASLSAGTSLRANVTTLKAALVNASQGSSLLQVADGALSQVSDILQRQKALAVQAGGGSLSAAERSFLNQEFSALTSEIDRLVNQTNFSGVKLLDGSLTDKVAATSVTAAGEKGTASIALINNMAAADTLSLNGVTITARATAGTVASTATTLDFVIGGDIATTLDNLVAALNTASTNSTLSAATQQRLSAATYSRSGNSLVVTSNQSGEQSNNYIINAGASTFLTAAANAIVSGGSATNTYTLFAANTIVANDIDTSVVAAAASATTQLEAADIIALGLNGAALTTVYTAVAGDSLRTIVSNINANTATTGITASIIGSSGAYNIRFEDAGVTTSGKYNASKASKFTATGSLANADASVTVNTASAAGTSTFIYSLDGGSDTGISAGKTVGVGVVGDSLVAAQSQQKSQVDLVFPNINPSSLIASFTNTTTVTVGLLTDLTTFTFAPTVADQSKVAAGEIAVGATLTETLDNFVTAFNTFQGNKSQNYAMNQLEAVRDGNTIHITTKDYGDSRDITSPATALTIATANLPTGAASTLGASGLLNSGTTGGITTSGVTNSSFVGTVSGFTSTYTSKNLVDASITVGGNVYFAKDIDTVPAADTIVRFSSTDGGGYFDVELAGSSGQVVGSQTNANTFASRLDTAFSTLSFYQDRNISTYSGGAAISNSDGDIIGSLRGTSVSLNSDDFTSTAIENITVESTSGGVISFTINGEKYTSASNLGDNLAANSIVKLTNALDTSKFLTFRVGDSAIDFSSLDNASAFEAALKTAFGVGDGSANLQFQVGSSTADTLKVGIESVTTDSLFNGAALDVLTSEHAAIASAAIDEAIRTVTAVRAGVGSIQSRFNYVAASVESSIQNQDAARGALLDTDISSESTAFATAQVQLQAGIAVLAQANQMPQQLLKLIG